MAYVASQLLILKQGVITESKWAAYINLSVLSIYFDFLKITSSEKILFTQNIKTVSGNWTSIKLSETFMLRIGFEQTHFLK